MVNVDKLVADFSKLPYEDQRKKIIFMLEWLKDAGERFRELLDLIQTTTQVDTSILIDIYAAVITFGAEMQEHEASQARDKFAQAQARLTALQQQEASAKNDADDILSQI